MDLTGSSEQPELRPPPGEVQSGTIEDAVIDRWPVNLDECTFALGQ
jgi:hypothetical protein